VVVARTARRPEWWALAILVACGSDERKEVTHYQDVGAVCLFPLSAGGARVQAVLNGCVTACAEVRASCTAKLLEGILELEAEGSSTRTFGGDPPDECPAVCQRVEASCALPSVPDGSYELRYGERSTQVELPVASAGAEVLPAAEGYVGCSAAVVMQ